MRKISAAILVAGLSGLVLAQGEKAEVSAMDQIQAQVAKAGVDKSSFPVDIVINEEGFIEPATENGGIFAAGCSSDALDVNRAVQQATGAALRAIQVVNRVAGTEG